MGYDFWCINCKNLKTLEGAPKKVFNDFSCTDCENLTSLKGAPDKVGGVFDCSSCKNLKITDQDKLKHKIRN